MAVDIQLQQIDPANRVRICVQAHRKQVESDFHLLIAPVTCDNVGDMSPQIDTTEVVLTALNEALKAELTAVHQYLLHARMCANWGYKRLSEYNRTESNEEFAHAELLIDRILFLKGTPNMAETFPIQDCANVKAQMESDLAFEMDAIVRLNAAVRAAADAGDNVSRQLFEKILIDENHHVDYLEGQLHVINEVGLQNYLSQQIH